MNDIKTTSEVLDLAADAIQQHGWGRGIRTWTDTGSGLCLEGGIMAALGMREASYSNGELWSCPAYSAVAEYLGVDQTMDDDDLPSEPLWLYNDTIAESGEEVIAVLRAAAAVERTKEAVYSDEDQPLPVEVGA